MKVEPKKKLAIYLPHMEGGGVQKIVHGLIGGFLHEGIRVDLLLNHRVGIWLESLPAEVRVLELKTWGPIRIGSLSRYLRDEKPDALLSLLEGPNFLSCILKKLGLAKTRVVASVRNMDDQVIAQYPLGPKKIIFSLFYRRVLNWADAVIAVSEGVRREFVLRGKGVSPEKVITILNPVDLDWLARKAEEPIIEKWFEAVGGPFLLGAGRLEYQKDFETLIRAFALLQHRWAGKLVILGEGSENSRLQSLVLELGLTSKVFLPGYVQNPWKFMKKASAFALSSRHEGFGNVVAEALACGTPVVSTNCPSGPTELLKGGKWGRLVPVGDPEALSQALWETLQEPRSTSDNQWLKEFNIEKTVRRYMEVLGLVHE